MVEKKLRMLEKEINTMDTGRIDINHEKAKILVGKF